MDRQGDRSANRKSNTFCLFTGFAVIAAAIYITFFIGWNEAIKETKTCTYSLIFKANDGEGECKLFKIWSRQATVDKEIEELTRARKHTFQNFELSDEDVIDYKTINELYKGSTVAPLSNNSFFMLYNHPNFTNLDSHEYVVKKLANDSRRYPEVGLFSVGWTITQEEGEKKYDHISSIVSRITPVRMTAFLHNGGCDTISCKLFSPLLQKVFDIIPRVKKLVMIRNTKLSLSEIEKLVKGSSQLEAFSLDGNLVYPDNQDKKELDFDSKLEYKIERFCIHNLDGHLKLISDKTLTDPSVQPEELLDLVLKAVSNSSLKSSLKEFTNKNSGVSLDKWNELMEKYGLSHIKLVNELCKRV